MYHNPYRKYRHLSMPGTEVTLMTNPLVLQPFRHRNNLDGTWDSICMRCYATAAHSHEQASLERAELRHHCDETSWLYKEPAGDSRVRASGPFGGRGFSAMRGGRPAGLRERSQSQGGS
jgi:hypothetical protein